jgi:hypothetical protein
MKPINRQPIDIDIRASQSAPRYPHSLQRDGEDRRLPTVDARLLLISGEGGGDPRYERFTICRPAYATKEPSDGLTLRFCLRGLNGSFGYSGWSSAFGKFAIAA